MIRRYSMSWTAYRRPAVSHLSVSALSELFKMQPLQCRLRETLKLLRRQHHLSNVAALTRLYRDWLEAERDRDR